MDIARWIPNHQNFFPSILGTLGSALCKLKTSLQTERLIPQNSTFGIEEETGFQLSVPLERLPNTFDFWENALTEAQSTLSLGTEYSNAAVAKLSEGNIWRRKIREVRTSVLYNKKTLNRTTQGPVINTRILEDNTRALQRAHLVLAFLVHFYVHSMLPSEKATGVVVPKTLAVPLVAVSDILGTAPVLTYSDTVLWNLVPRIPEQPITMDNLKAAQLFSGTDDEEQFYITSAGVEIRGAEILQIIESYYMLPDVQDVNAIATIATMLTRVAGIIGEISDIIQSIRAGCDPQVFNYSIRHWFEGSDANGPTAPAWVYEGADPSRQLDLSGPSAGQSPTMHALDLWLDIDHKLAEKRKPVPSEENRRADTGFMQRM